MRETKWIFVADDDPDDIDMLCEAILAQNPQAAIKTFADGESLLHYLQTEPGTVPYVILLDYNMPMMSGLEVLQALAQEPAYAQVPKLFWSTSDRHETVQTCLNAGAAEYFVKPSSPRGLSRLAERIITYCTK